MSSIAIAGSGGSGGGVFTLVTTVPVNQNAPGSPFDVVWDGAGNMYVCYRTNTWAKYVNAAPFSNIMGRFVIQGNVLYFRSGQIPPILRIGTGSA